jgi:hypothetical protein
MKDIFYLKFFDRYESETKTSIAVGNQASTSIDFMLKRTVFDDDKQDSSKIKFFYNQSKEFILHQTLFLIIAGVCGLYTNRQNQH